MDDKGRTERYPAAGQGARACRISLDCGKTNICRNLDILSDRLFHLLTFHVFNNNDRLLFIFRSHDQFPQQRIFTDAETQYNRMSFLNDIGILLLQSNDPAAHRTGKNTDQHAGKDHTGKTQQCIQDDIQQRTGI